MDETRTDLLVAARNDPDVRLLLATLRVLLGSGARVVLQRTEVVSGVTENGVPTTRGYRTRLVVEFTHPAAELLENVPETPCSPRPREPSCVLPRGDESPRTGSTLPDEEADHEHPIP